MLASIIIRTLNEAEHLDALLDAIALQEIDDLQTEVVVIDSGSTDGTLEIAKRHRCRLEQIRRDEFSFGRSLNRGCEAASGDLLVFVSGHCVPTNAAWLGQLCKPLVGGRAAYVYGRQVGDDDSNYSERRVFAKYFGAESRIPQEGFYCNNANAAITREAWSAYRFDEEVTGLEDMELAKRLVAAGGLVAYVADACVFHHHSEDWLTVRRRFEREAIALQQIMPEIHVSAFDVIRYVLSSVFMDWRSAWRHGQLLKSWREIVAYRLMQFWGSYRGNNDHRRLSRTQKERYFYPTTTEEEGLNDWLLSHRRAAAPESKEPESQR